MDFKTYFMGLSLPEREAFAEQVGSTVGYLKQVAYDNKRIELGFADAICAASGGRVTHDGLPLNDRARHHMAVRSQPALAHALGLDSVERRG